MVPSFGVIHDSGYVYKLNKELYILKQTPYAWFKKFSIVIFSLKFVYSSQNFTLFVKYTDSGCIILSFYVDDMIITSNDINGISVLKI